MLFAWLRSGMAAASDEDLLTAAHDQNRIMLTCDRDYGSLVFVRDYGAGVIYLRIRPTTQNSVHAELSGGHAAGHDGLTADQSGFLRPATGMRALVCNAGASELGAFLFFGRRGLSASVPAPNTPQTISSGFSNGRSSLAGSS